MTDTIERAQEREQLDRDFALQEHQRAHKPGLAECEECGATISDLRQAIGARFCLPHQTQLELEQKKRGARTCL